MSHRAVLSSETTTISRARRHIDLDDHIERFDSQQPGTEPPDSQDLEIKSHRTFHRKRAMKINQGRDSHRASIRLGERGTRYWAFRYWAARERPKTRQGGKRSRIGCNEKVFTISQR